LEQHGGRIERWVMGHVGFVERRAWWIVLAALLLAATSIHLATKLRVVQDLKVLLPEDAVSLERLSMLEDRMGNLADLLVEIRSPSRDANLRFGAELQARLVARDEIRYSIFHQERTFFEDNALLYLSVEDLLDLRRRVIDRIAEEVSASLIEGFEDVPDPEDGAEDDDAFDLSEEDLRERYEIDKRLPEYLEADEGRIVVIRARPTRNTTDLAFTRALLAAVEGDIAELDPASYHPEMTVGIQGGYAARDREASTIAGDAERGGTAAAILLIVCLAFYFRRARAVPLVMVPLLISVVAALGYAQLRFGYLNLVSAFIFAVLLGLGIDFAVHVLGRYEHERGRGAGRTQALITTLSTTGMSTLAGAVSTIAVYAFLMVADFQGFAQFGELAAVGIFAAITSVFVVVPAFIVVLERWFPWKPRRHHLRRRDALAAAGGPPPPDAAPSRRMVVAAIVVLVAGVGWATFSAANVHAIEFEYNFNNLGPRQPVADEDVEEPDDDAPTFEDAVGKEFLFGPVVALTAGLEETEWIHRLLASAMDLTPDQAQRFAEVRAGTYVAPPEEGEVAPPEELEPPPEAPPTDVPGDDERDIFDLWDDEEEMDDPVFEALAASVGPGGALDSATLARFEAYDDARVEIMNRTLVQVFSVFTFIPDRQEDKLTIIRDIRRRIDAKRADLTEDTQRKLDDSYKYLEVERPVAVADLPEWVRVQFTDDEGELGRFVIFRNRGAKADYRVSKELEVAFFDLPTPWRVVPSAGNLYVMPEMLDTVAADGPVVVSLALLVVIITALLLFRSAVGLGAVLLTVVLAVLWLLGVMYVLEWKANFFNLIAIPLLLGMGQDDALHLFHRYKLEGIGRMGRVIRETGGAIFMTTLTTCIGFGGILFANHQGLLSLAWVSVIGLAFCFLASVFILPAVIVVTSHLRLRFGRRGTSAAGMKSPG